MHQRYCFRAIVHAWKTRPISKHWFQASDVQMDTWVQLFTSHSQHLNSGKPLGQSLWVAVGICTVSKWIAPISSPGTTIFLLHYAHRVALGLSVWQRALDQVRRAERVRESLFLARLFLWSKLIFSHEFESHARPWSIFVWCVPFHAYARICLQYTWHTIDKCLKRNASVDCIFKIIWSLSFYRY